MGSPVPSRVMQEQGLLLSHHFLFLVISRILAALVMLTVPTVHLRSRSGRSYNLAWYKVHALFIPPNYIPVNVCPMFGKVQKPICPRSYPSHMVWFIKNTSFTQLSALFGWVADTEIKIRNVPSLVWKFSDSFCLEKTIICLSVLFFFICF